MADKAAKYSSSDRIRVEHKDGRAFGIAGGSFDGSPLEKEGFKAVSFEDGRPFNAEPFDAEAAAKEPGSSKE